MRLSSELDCVFLTIICGFVLFFSIAVAPFGVAQAGFTRATALLPVTANGQAPKDQLELPTPGEAAPSALLNRADELAVLQAVHTALTEVADGATYVWHRNHGHLSGLVRPTSSFKYADGTVCRHIVLMLSSRRYNRKAEGIACRGDNGVWSLDG